MLNKKVLFIFVFVIFTLAFLYKLNNKLYEIRTYMVKADEFLSKPATEINQELVNYLKQKFNDDNLYVAGFDLEDIENYKAFIKSKNSIDTLFQVTNHNQNFSDNYDQKVASKANTYYRYYLELHLKRGDIESAINYTNSKKLDPYETDSENTFNILYYSKNSNDYKTLSKNDIEICKDIYGDIKIDSIPDINNFNTKAVFIHEDEDTSYDTKFIVDYIRNVFNTINEENVIIQKYDFRFYNKYNINDQQTEPSWRYDSITIPTLTKDEIQTIDLYKFIEANAIIENNISKDEK